MGPRRTVTQQTIDAKYSNLFVLAKEALEAEDRQLRRQFAAARRQHEGAYPDVASGLAYWLFETTLVYSVFKRWLTEVHVAWEYPTSPPHPNCMTAKGAKTKCDLVVFSDWKGTAVEAAIEAKWWNSNTPKADRYIREDVTKLRQFPGDTVRRYLMTFWWSLKRSYDHDLAHVKGFCEKEGLQLACDTDATRFNTLLSNGQKGYFVVAGLLVPAR